MAFKVRIVEKGRVLTKVVKADSWFINSTHDLVFEHKAPGFSGENVAAFVAWLSVESVGKK